ncbi:hypothetical protein TIFTF001_029893 [Ficus carica]|uniref:Uncharacterized protein n=1 Tax=Ficus carica TaxID=3494 RepID=A0AA88DSG1_FICCA|nr:hypothetical protein TIFTF001_029893 [Ficus carica]
MSHQQVLLNFAQQHLEPFHSVRWRYTELLIRFPYHDFLKECQLQNFLNELCATTRTWVERGNGTTSFCQLSMDEDYCLLEDMAEFDHWSWNSTMDNQALVGQFSEETKLCVEKLKRMEVLRQPQAELTRIQVELSRMNAPPNDSIEAMKRTALMVDFYTEWEASSEFHHDELTQNEEEWELFQDDSSGEEETQDLYIDEESQEKVYESQPLDISNVTPPPI